MLSRKSIMRGLYILVRLCICLYLAIMVAHYLNNRNYSDHIGRALVKIHAEGRGFDVSQIAKLLLEGDRTKIQELIDRNASIFALVITDCTAEKGECSGEKILFATNPSLLRGGEIRPAELARYPYALLRRPSSSVLNILENEVKGGGGKGAIIGRVYSISTIPGFEEDYRLWMRDPFRNDDLSRRYLITMTTCLAGGIGAWLLVELFLKIRQIERKNARQREHDLLRDADLFLRQFEVKERQLEEEERRSRSQYEVYIGRIRELERKLQNVDDYRRSVETIIRELEDEKTQQSVTFREELERTNLQKQALQAEFEKYRKDPRKDRPGASTALEMAINPQFANSFEKKVFTAIMSSPTCRKGDWSVVTNFDVAIGKGGSQFVDCMVISRDCLIVVEAKNYSGRIVAEGDPENTAWLCNSNDGTTVEVKSSWGINPYHQVREYTMSLMNLVKRGRWKLSAYGVIVFPEGTDIEAMAEKIGKFYRVTTFDRLVGLLGNLDAEARRANTFTKRPSPEQIENLIRGK
ncbi:MAG: nuclease [Geobacter sp.]|nr:MAG: nuclease [Geobacter sp.]